MKKTDFIMVIFCIIGAIYPLLSAISNFVIASADPWVYLGIKSTFVMHHEFGFIQQITIIWNEVLPLITKLEISFDIAQCIIFITCAYGIIRRLEWSKYLLLIGTIIVVVWNIIYFRNCSAV